MDIKQIITELIKFEKDFELPSFMKNRKEDININVIDSIITDLLLWQKTIFRRNARGKVLDMNIFNQTEYFIRHHDIECYETLLNNYPELSKIFSIKDDVITLNPILKESEILEIRQMIEDGFEVVLRVNISPSKKTIISSK